MKQRITVLPVPPPPVEIGEIDTKVMLQNGAVVNVGGWYGRAVQVERDVLVLFPGLSLSTLVGWPGA